MMFLPVHALWNVDSTRWGLMSFGGTAFFLFLAYIALMGHEGSKHDPITYETAVKYQRWAYMGMGFLIGGMLVTFLGGVSLILKVI